MEKLLVIDGNSIINRAFYGVRPLTTKDGMHTNAIYGMINIIEKHLHALNPEYAAVAFDLKAPTFRHKMYDAYKAGRRATPEELLEQFAPAKDVLRAMGFTIVEKEGYEADDIIGTLANAAAKAGKEAYVLTGDRDSLQLIGDGVTVLLATNTETIHFDRAAFVEHYGVEPSRFVDVKAIMGDKSDNIPGVAGIGEKGALKFISEFGTLEKLYAELETTDKISEKQKEKLRADRDNAFLSQTLARIDTNAPCGITLEDTRMQETDRAALYSLFTKLEFNVFLKRYGLGEDDLPQAEAVEEPIVRTDAAALTEVLAGKPFAFAPFGSEFSFSDGEKVYLAGGNIADFAPLLQRDDLICHDLKELSALCAPHGFLPSENDYDIMLAAYAINAGEGSFALDRLATAYAGTAYKEDAPAAGLIYRIYKATEQRLAEDGIVSLYRGMELPLCRVLYEMERDGFKLDTAGLAAYGDKLKSMQLDLEERIYMLAGGQFNINSPKQLGEVLFERLGLPCMKKTKTGYSTNAEVLEKLRPYHPIVDEVLEYRKVAKLCSTYVEGLLKVADEGGFVHTVFKQTGTATGRLSSAEPNLQNIPIRTEMGHELRRFFIPCDGDHVLIDADYSQIELRLLAHVAGDETMINAFLSGEDIHASTASAVFGVPMSEVTSELRKRAKAVNFGIVYGIGDYSLAMDLGITKKQAGEYIKSYLARFGAIDRYLKDTIASAYEKGYVETIFGRRRYIPELKASNKITKSFGERVAMNSPIQGSAADIIKIAMIGTRRALKAAGIDAKLILQVHDELVVEAARDCADEAAEILRREMENAVKLSVPLSVELTIGDTWYENK
ncbi:MAG: DNA polymerase I [Clostridia bacterium]|nr:DNA polymerase I [Clostridia bacterium]